MSNQPLLPSSSGIFASGSNSATPLAQPSSSSVNRAVISGSHSSRPATSLSLEPNPFEQSFASTEKKKNDAATGVSSFGPKSPPILLSLNQTQPQQRPYGNASGAGAASGTSGSFTNSQNLFFSAQRPVIQSPAMLTPGGSKKLPPLFFSPSYFMSNQNLDGSTAPASLGTGSVSTPGGGLSSNFMPYITKTGLTPNESGMRSGLTPGGFLTGNLNYPPFPSIDTVSEGINGNGSLETGLRNRGVIATTNHKVDISSNNNNNNSVSINNSNDTKNNNTNAVGNATNTMSSSVPPISFRGISALPSASAPFSIDSRISDAETNTFNFKEETASTITGSTTAVPIPTSTANSSKDPSVKLETPRTLSPGSNTAFSGAYPEGTGNVSSGNGLIDDSITTKSDLHAKRKRSVASESNEQQQQQRSRVGSSVIPLDGNGAVEGEVKPEPQTSEGQESSRNGKGKNVDTEKVENRRKDKAKDKDKDKSQGSLDEKDRKRREFLERNRVAASKFRKRKKEYIKRIENEIQFYEAEYNDMANVLNKIYTLNGTSSGEDPSGCLLNVMETALNTNDMRMAREVLNYMKQLIRSTNIFRRSGKNPVLMLSSGGGPTGGSTEKPSTGNDNSNNNNVMTNATKGGETKALGGTFGATAGPDMGSSAPNVGNQQQQQQQPFQNTLNRRPLMYVSSPPPLSFNSNNDRKTEVGNHSSFPTSYFSPLAPKNDSVSPSPGIVSASGGSQGLLTSGINNNGAGYNNRGNVTVPFGVGSEPIGVKGLQGSRSQSLDHVQSNNGLGGGNRSLSDSSIIPPQ